MGRASAGLVMYRVRDGKLEVLLVHPGGPFWAKKDAGAWFVPKGELAPGESELSAARREFEEETGLQPEGSFLPLGSVKHKSGKTVTAWAFEGDCDPASLKSNSFTLEWPPRSGKHREFPEVDRAAFFTVEQAEGKIHPDEFELLLRLQESLKQPAQISPFTRGRNDDTARLRLLSDRDSDPNCGRGSGLVPRGVARRRH